MTTTEAWQGWLALEHEAVWLYPVIGARFDALAERARGSHAAHRSTRDRLLARLHALDVEPEAARLTYDVTALRTAKQAVRAARRVERGIAAACIALVGESADEDTRTYAITGLRRAALADRTWGGPPRAFPGLSAQS
ncbi:MAG: hypothetical protein JWP56_2413 [Aeromicrobium sp.]|nr:hypothetical protein [Aeromicrobium sp.]